MKKRNILILFTSLMCFSGSMEVSAKTSPNALQNIQTDIQQKAQEKQAVNKEIQNIQQEVTSLTTYISNNQKALDNTRQKMAETKQLIEQKRENIVTLEDNILKRKDVMKNRLIALQHDDNFSLLIRVFLDSRNLNDFLQRASAVTTIFNADNDILTAQQNDLRQIEEDKNVIDKQEQILENEQTSLAQQQNNLNSSLHKRQATLTNLQNKFSLLDKQMSLAQQEKSTIITQIKAAQEKLKLEQMAAKAVVSQSIRQITSGAAPAGNGQEMYVTATAYSPEESGSTTTLGYNIKKNPNMKLIAVDPSVIPLGKKVWVEGYGVAVAGDTGGAIQGYRIDVLMPTKAACIQWGRRTVKIVVLN